jgi:hypothetical protein
MTDNGWFWSEQDNESLKALRLTNMPNAQIAKTLCRTKKSVQAHVHRLGLPLRRYVRAVKHSEPVAMFSLGPPSVAFVRCLVGREEATYRMVRP